MTELEKLGYKKQSIGGYTEWVNKKENVRISYVANGTIMIQSDSNNQPVPVYPKELMALMLDLGFAELTGETE